MKTYLFVIISAFVAAFSSVSHAGPGDRYKSRNQSAAGTSTEIISSCYVMKSKSGGKKPAGLKRRVTVPCLEKVGNVKERKATYKHR